MLVCDERRYAPYTNPHGSDKDKGVIAMEIFIEEVRIAFYIQAGIVLDRRTEDDGLGKFRQQTVCQRQSFFGNQYNGCLFIHVFCFYYKVAFIISMGL